MKNLKQICAVGLAVIGLLQTDIVIAAPVEYEMTFTIQYAGNNATTYTGHAFDVGTQSKGRIVFDESVLTLDGYHLAEVTNLFLTVGLETFTHIHNVNGYSQSAVGLFIENGIPIRIQDTSLYGPDDMTYVDSFLSAYTSGPAGYESYAKLYIGDFNTSALISVAGEITFERVPEPDSLILVMVAMLSMAVTARRRVRRRTTFRT